MRRFGCGRQPGLSRGVEARGGRYRRSQAVSSQPRAIGAEDRKTPIAAGQKGAAAIDRDHHSLGPIFHPGTDLHRKTRIADIDHRMALGGIREEGEVADEGKIASAVGWIEGRADLDRVARGGDIDHPKSKVAGGHEGEVAGRRDRNPNGGTSAPERD